MNKKIKKTPIEKELDRIAHREARLAKQALHHQPARWKESLEQKIPPRVYTNLQTAFCKAFELIFEKGTGLIEKTYSRNELELDFQIHDYAVALKGGTRELRELKTDINRGNFINMAVSAVEGIQYGFSYDTPREKLFILKLLETAMLKGEAWITCNAEADSYFVPNGVWLETKFQEQVKRTADAFAVDMLLAKFVQGIPVAGILGGISNPVYYRRILYYVQLKYQKRYLLQKSLSDV